MNQPTATLFVFFGFTYIVWGTALLLWLCIKCALVGSVKERLLHATAISSLAVALFNPVMLGDSHFGMVVPWYFGLAEPMLVKTYAAFPIAVFCLAFLVNFFSGKRHPA